MHCFCIVLCDVQGRTVGLSALFVLDNVVSRD